MTFPAVAAADSKSGTVTSNSTSWTLTYPTNIAVGDLLLMFAGVDGNTSVSSLPAGWISTSNGSSPVSNLLAKKSATGSETGTFTLSISASEQGAWRVIRIPAAQWEGTLGTTWFAAASTDGAVQSVAGTGGASTSPNSGSLDPFNWDAEDTLWVSFGGSDSTVTWTGFPANYTQEDHVTAGGHTATSGGATGAGLGVAYRQLNASSEDPGAFTLSASEDWIVTTLAIRPATAAVASLLIPHRHRGLIVR